jgi:hypothetical protein
MALPTNPFGTGPRIANGSGLVSTGFGITYPTATGIVKNPNYSFPGQLKPSSGQAKPSQQAPAQQSTGSQQSAPQMGGGGVSAGGGMPAGGWSGQDMTNFMSQLAGMMGQQMAPPPAPEKPKTHDELFPNGSPSGPDYKDPRMQGPSWIGGANLFDDQSKGQNFTSQLANRPQQSTPAPTTPTPTTPTTPSTPTTPTTPSTPARPGHHGGHGGMPSRPHGLMGGVGLLGRLGGGLGGRLGGGLGHTGGGLGGASQPQARPARPAAPSRSGGRWW